MTDEQLETIRARADARHPDPYLAVGDRDDLLEEVDRLRDILEDLIAPHLVPATAEFPTWDVYYSDERLPAEFATREEAVAFLLNHAAESRRLREGGR